MVVPSVSYKHTLYLYYRLIEIFQKGNATVNFKVFGMSLVYDYVFGPLRVIRKGIGHLNQFCIILSKYVPKGGYLKLF